MNNNQNELLKLKEENEALKELIRHYINLEDKLRLPRVTDSKFNAFMGIGFFVLNLIGSFQITEWICNFFNNKDLSFIITFIFVPFFLWFFNILQKVTEFKKD